MKKQTKKLKFRIIKNKSNKPCIHSIKYRDTVIANVPDYLGRKTILQIVEQLNRSTKPFELNW